MPSAWPLTERLKPRHERGLLVANKLNNGFAPLNRFKDSRHGSEKPRNQRSIVYVADADPQDNWSGIPSSAKQGEIAILGHKNCGTGDSCVPNLCVRSGRQSQFSHMNCLEARLTHGCRKRRRKLGIDQIRQAIPPL